MVPNLFSPSGQWARSDICGGEVEPSLATQEVREWPSLIQQYGGVGGVAKPKFRFVGLGNLAAGVVVLLAAASPPLNFLMYGEWWGLAAVALWAAFSPLPEVEHLCYREIFLLLFFLSLMMV